MRSRLSSEASLYRFKIILRVSSNDHQSRRPGSISPLVISRAVCAGRSLERSPLVYSAGFRTPPASGTYRTRCMDWAMLIRQHSSTLRNSLHQPKLLNRAGRLKSLMLRKLSSWARTRTCTSPYWLGFTNNISEITQTLEVAQMTAAILKETNFQTPTLQNPKLGRTMRLINGFHFTLHTNEEQYRQITEVK